jgi:hypothetical protein
MFNFILLPINLAKMGECVYYCKLFQSSKHEKQYLFFVYHARVYMGIDMVCHHFSTWSGRSPGFGILPLRARWYNIAGVL